MEIYIGFSQLLIVLFRNTYDNKETMENNPIQSPFDVWRNGHSEYKSAYSNHEISFVKQLIPEIAVGLNVFEIFQILQSRFGTDKLVQALNPGIAYPSRLAGQQNGDWLKTSNMAGVNIRTIGNFFNLIKYLLTTGSCHDSIHILPIWEPGVVSSLYGKISWNINPEFFSEELKNAIPNLDTVEKQLKVVTNLIHMMGKSVGLDVIPHTDRFSELVFLHPQMFEWVKRKDHHILAVNTQNGTEAEDIIWAYLNNSGTADGSLISYSKAVFFDFKNPILTEQQRLEVLFGKVEEREKRLQRRLEMMQQLLYNGLETLPVTMAPPYRGLHLVENDFIYDKMGNKWYNYQFDKPEAMSRVFGPLTRYKFYHAENNQELEFDNPNTPVWEYVCQKYYECQQAYNFDFMRGDMAHVQPRSGGVPEQIDAYYDPLKAIKNYVVKQGVKHFGFFAETFIAPPDTMGYGNEIDHLEAIEADSTLGDLQATPVGSEVFMTILEEYINIAETRKFTPNFTMITADKDDPRFDEFYKKGNHLRFFVGLFLPILPSYMSLGFECRNTHLERGLNEEYTKLYVFQINDDAETDKVTHGPFIWGKDYGLFAELEKMKLLFETIQKETSFADFKWVSKPSKTNFVAEWSLGDYLFVVNFHAEEILSYAEKDNYKLIYSSADFVGEHECRVFRTECV
jgi:hypothetical protein